MEISQQQFEQPQQEKNPFFYIKIIFFEFFFVVFLLAVIFGIMLFSGIIHIPPTLPTFSLLTQTKKLPTAQPIDIKQLQDFTKNYISNTVNSQFIPPNNIPTTTKGASIYSNWTTSSSSLESFVTLNTAHNAVKTYLIRVATYAPQKLDASISAQLAQQYFKDAPTASWECSTSALITMCSVTLPTSTGWKQYGAFHLNTFANDLQVTVYACTIPEKLESNKVQNSCIGF
ncbi:MAG TPA: hypothetical protein VLB73_03900 [Patescibacteria group bacterium]|nr:hypothetical protein [Patescibacteria group bacterium]